MEILAYFIIVLTITFVSVNAQTATCSSLGLTLNTDSVTCMCDLTYNGCDVDCCCDPNCQSELLAFTTCIDQSIPINENLCFQTVTSFANNTPTSSIQKTQGLFCVYTDNYLTASYYDVPSELCTTELFDQAVSQYQTYAYISTPPIIDINTAAYKSGDPIYTVYLYDQQIPTFGILSLPLTSGPCLNGPITFLSNEKASCSAVSLSDLATSCKNETSLDASYYYKNFKVVSTPIILNSNGTAPDYNAAGLLDIQVQKFVCKDTQGLIVTCSFGNSYPGPTVHGDNCSNSVTEVLYAIQYNSSEIAAISVSFVIQTVNFSSLPLTQKFETYFYQGSEYAFKYSGNPGYLVGQPVLAGRNVSNTTSDVVASAIQLNTDPNNWMTMAAASSNSATMGQCTQESRVPVLFGENAMSACIVSFTYDNMSENCAVISNYLRDVILPGNNVSTYVAMYGNSPVTNILDWVLITDNNNTVDLPSPVGIPPGTNGPGCQNMITGLDIQISYANTGAFNNPQPKITKVFYNYTFQDSVLFQCIGEYCQSPTMQLAQQFEVVSSVTFIDVSNPAVSESGQIPQPSARLPADFFYPFQ